MKADLRILAERQAAICSIFSNVNRVMILWAVVDQEKSVGEIASVIDASLQCTSQHLRLMKDMGVLETRRDGQTIYYSIVRNGFSKTCQLVLQACQRQV